MFSIKFPGMKPFDTCRLRLYYLFGNIKYSIIYLSTKVIMVLPYYCFATLFLLQGFHCLEHVHNITFSAPLLVNQTLVSSAQVFELGFFTPNGSKNLYVGIWYKDRLPIQPVWVANREKPLASTDQSAILTIGSDGNINLLDGHKNLLWSTYVTAGSNGSVAGLLDNGNFVLTSGISGNTTWESFDYPGNILLPGMKIGIDSKTGVKQFLISWKSDIDPSPGSFIVGLSSEIPPQAFIWKGSRPHFRGGQWDKSKFIGIPDMNEKYNNGFNVEVDIQRETSYFSFNAYNGSFFKFFLVSPEGSLKLMYWEDGSKQLLTIWETPRDRCEEYGTCGLYGVCNALGAHGSPRCRCLSGFKPLRTEEWNRGNWTSGCTRNAELNCEKNRSTSSSTTTKNDVFAKIRNMKLPDSADYIPDISSAGDCGSWCLSNCSCLAYAYVRSIGCMIWMQHLMDLQQFNTSGEDLYFRLAYLGAGGKRTLKLAVGLSIFASIVISAGATFAIIKWRTHRNGKTHQIPPINQLVNMDDTLGHEQKESKWRAQLQKEDAPELAMLSIESLLAATNNFSVSNKLGQGGFGPVYKGKLQDGNDIAVKRLSSNSGQGMEEFKNEIILISKLQHRNLVRLLGCCIEKGERILVYEYLSNKSLDTFIFDARKKTELNWDKRFQIIQGIARGLLYLHRDSLLRVIHRDLKVSNILLDEKMNPKISDFGLARMFEGTREWVNTHRVVGTFGYMSPEYAMGGIFSEKSDVYSFGVLLLETVSSKKNSPVYYKGQYLNLLSHAWELWSEGRAMDIVDEELAETLLKPEVIKCIQVGLLCVQDHAADRPNMSDVVFMLGGDSNLREPKQSTFTFQSLSNVHSQQESIWSKNTITDSFIEGR